MVCSTCYDVCRSIYIETLQFISQWIEGNYFYTNDHMKCFCYTVPHGPLMNSYISTRDSSMAAIVQLTYSPCSPAITLKQVFKSCLILALALKKILPALTVRHLLPLLFQTRETKAKDFRKP